MKITNNGQFNAVLSQAKQAGKSMRDSYQACLEYGFEQAATSGRLTFLSSALNGASGTTGISANRMKGYIQAHANVKWSKTKGSNVLQFKANGKLKITMPTESWYEFEGGDVVKADMDSTARIKSLYTSLVKAIDSGKVKDMDTAIAQRDALAVLVA